MATQATTAATDPQDTSSAWGLGPATPWLWAAGSLVWYVAAAYLTLPVVTALPAQFLLQPLIWGCLVLGGVLLLARVGFGGWLRVSWSALTLALCGLVLAGLLEESLHAWAIDRFGTFSWQLIGPTAGLFAVAVGSAVAGFGVLLAPRRATLAPLVFAIAGALVSGVVVAVNMPGASDGLDAGSIVSALLIAAAGAYAWIVAFISVWVAVRRELSDDGLTSG